MTSRWLAYPESFVRTNYTPAATLTVLVAALVIQVVCHVFAEALAVSPTAVSIATVAWCSMIALTYFAPDRVNGAGVGGAFARGVSLTTTVVYCCVFGATSPLALSPTYAFAAASVASNGAAMVHRSPRLLVAHGFVPLALRLSLGPPAPTPTSLLLAALVGVLGSLATLRASRTISDWQEREIDLSEARDEIAKDHATFARMAAGLALHDGLSGLLVVARARASTARSCEELAPVVRVLIATAAPLSSAEQGETAERTLERLSAIASVVGSRFVRGPGTPRTDLPPDDRRQLSELSFESVLNALRGSPSMVRLTWHVDDASVGLTCESTAGQGSTAGTGRGLRYATLRVRARGGHAVFEPGRHARFSCAWPRAGGRSWRHYPAPRWIAASLVAPAVAIGALTSEWPAALFACIASAPAVASFAAMRRRGFEIEADERALAAASVEHVSSPRRVLVRESMGPPMDAVAAAFERGDLPALRASLAAASAALGDVLRHLEEA